MIHRSGSDSNVAIPDRVSFNDLIEKVDEAVATGSELQMNTGRSCGLPQRLLLPKGNKEGLEFWFSVIITSGDDAAHSDLDTNDYGGNHGYCGIRGEKYPDKRPMGFPFDRPIPKKSVLVDQPNFNSHIVRIYHKNE